MKTCFFTGHRKIPISTMLAENTAHVITDLITNNGVTDFYAGGAVGWDTICAKLILSLKEKYPKIRLHLVLPCSPEIQTIKWNDKQKEEYYTILKFADNVEFISKNYSNECMKKRNARLVELGEICLCYYNEKNFRSGTGQTVRMAQKAGKKIINLYDSAK